MSALEPPAVWLRRLAYRELRPWFAALVDAAVERISRLGRPLGPGQTDGTCALARQSSHPHQEDTNG